jgi:hypothetical protein
MTARIRGEVGVLLVNPLRDAVAQSRFEGYNVELWIGKSGWFSKDFIVKGDEVAVRAIFNWLKEFAKIEKEDLQV